MSLQEMLARTFWGNSIESYLWFFGLIVFGIIFNKWISTMISRGLFLILKRFAQKLGSPKSFTSFLLKPVEFILLAIIVYYAIHQLQHPLDFIFYSTENYNLTVKKVIGELFQLSLVFGIAWMSFRTTDFFALIFELKAAKTESKADDQIVHFVKELVKIFIFVIALMVVLGGVFHVNVAGILAGLGIGGIAIALAAKETLENLIASFTIFMDKPFVMGDLVTVHGTTGTVEKVGFRSTRLRTLEKSFVTIPNRLMIDDALDNLTLRTSRRAKFEIGMMYSTTTSQLKSITTDIRQMLDDHELVFTEDSIVRFENFGDSSLNILVMCFINTTAYEEYLLIKEQINHAIMEIVEKNGTGFAFPTRTLHLYKEN
jgi:MscS family membrane protein